MKKKLKTLAAGTVFAGDSGRKYKVLKQEEGQTKVITLDLMAGNKVFDEDGPDYKSSELRGFIDNELLPLIEEDFGYDNLVEHEVDLTTVDMQKDYGGCIVKARPITFDEAREFNELIVKEDLSDWWWTCTPWSIPGRGWKYGVAVVCPSGYISMSNSDVSRGVRPACILKSNIFVSTEE